MFEIVLCSSGDNQENVTEGAVLSSDSSPPLDSKGKVTQKPCPFGLIKSLDPIVVIFFKKCQKNYKCWIKCISKKFTTTGSANTCNFFGNEKILISKKITTMGSKHH